MITERFECIPFGGDYCPEQWDAKTWREDIRIMKHYGVNTVTTNVHSWVETEPGEGIIDFTFLDQTIGMLTENGFRIIMGTGTTAVPRWMAEKYPEMLLTDIGGIHHTPGTRENYCPNSKIYRERIARICGKLAEHFRDNHNIKLWHLANELGHVCYCENCKARFRDQMKKKYVTLERLNRAWNTAIWGQTYTEWDQIAPPSMLNEVYAYSEGHRSMMIHSLPTEAIEYLRFFSDANRECYEIQANAIRQYIPDAIVTNNFQFRTLDYHRVCAASDVIAFDSYPKKGEAPFISAMNYDICRCLQEPGKPFMMMEMSPNQASWEYCTSIKRPGQVELNALRGIAHGADSALFFQIRRSRAGFEKFHGAMIAHIGHERTRISDELCKLGQDLKKLEPYIAQTTIPAKVAVICDFDNMFGVEIPCTYHKDIHYFEEVGHYYRYFNENNIPVDAIQSDADLSAYRLIVAPMYYMLDKTTAERIERFVEEGGIFVCTYYSGIADLNDEIYPGGYPGALHKLMGIWVEETDALRDDESNVMRTGKKLGNREISCGYICDLIHAETAEVLGTYACDFYSGMPCLTQNNFGAGKAVYIGAKPDVAGTDVILAYCCGLADVRPVMNTPIGVEAIKRVGGGNELLFLMNNTEQPAKITIEQGWKHVLGSESDNNSLTLPSYGVGVYRKE